MDGCRRALELADQHEEVYAILGIHPHAANDATDDDVAEVRSLLAHPKAVGAGGVLSPALAAWTPNILVGVAAVYLLRKAPT